MTYKHYETCRVCGSSNLMEVLNLGDQPPANAYLNNPEDKEKNFPLILKFCKDCGLLQLTDVVEPSELFKNYNYFTGYSSTTMKEHFQKFASELEKDLKLTMKDIVVDIGGNDGTLLDCFIIPSKINVEPSWEQALVTRNKGIKTYPTFFSSHLARQIVDEVGKAKVITATNVFAHLDNLYDFMAGVKFLLQPDGVFIIEVHHALNLIQNVEWTNIYHEHLTYWSLAPLNILASKFGLNILRVEEIPSQGGSIRVTFGNVALMGKWSGYNEVIQKEYKAKLYQPRTYKAFKKKVETNVWELRGLLARLKEDGMIIFGYGCPAKTATLTNYANIGTETLTFITDTTPAKQGKFTPGKHIPIIADKEQLCVDYGLIFPWNYTDEILAKEKEFLEKGGKFIVPCPKVKVIQINKTKGAQTP